MLEPNNRINSSMFSPEATMTRRQEEDAAEKKKNEEFPNLHRADNPGNISFFTSAEKKREREEEDRAATAAVIANPKIFTLQELKSLSWDVGGEDSWVDTDDYDLAAKNVTDAAVKIGLLPFLNEQIIKQRPYLKEKKEPTLFDLEIKNDLIAILSELSSYRGKNLLVDILTNMDIDIENVSNETSNTLFMIEALDYIQRHDLVESEPIQKLIGNIDKYRIVLEDLNKSKEK